MEVAMANILITGTSKGIGLETALALGRAGHRVFATMRSLDRGAALRSAVEAEKLPVSLLQMDVDSDESVANASSAVRVEIGSLDVVVNNAGIERAGSV